MKPPAKSRRTKGDCPHRDHRAKPRANDAPGDDREGMHAPGHMGGQFDEAGYSSGRGQFGFQIDTLQ